MKISFILVALYICTLLFTLSFNVNTEVEARAGPDMSKYNTRVGTKFLEENKLKEGVTTTASGLQYKILEHGTGKLHPSKEDSVSVHYRGTLLSGKEFDSSYKRGQPATFGVTQVIPGWTEALQLMKPGDVYELYIPSDLAYGTRGAGNDIGANAALIFKVELLEIIGKEKAETKSTGTQAESSETPAVEEL